MALQIAWDLTQEHQTLGGWAGLEPVSSQHCDLCSCSWRIAASKGVERGIPQAKQGGFWLVQPVPPVFYCPAARLLFGEDVVKIKCKNIISW